MESIIELENAFEANSNPDNARAMSKYMKDIFPFYGIKTTERKLILRQIWKQNKQEIGSNARQIALQLFERPEREFHYCAIEILIKGLKKKYLKDDIQWIEKLITTNSWWDSVDSIAKNILGEYLLEYPHKVPTVIAQFSSSDNMWLNRSALLFQLGYKEKTNPELLFSLCLKFSGSNEFFIRKAIGWALREYAKTNPEAVKDFVLNNKLKPLSSKEALKNLN